MLRRGPGTIRRTGCHLLAFLKECNEEEAKLIIGAISDAGRNKRLGSMISIFLAPETVVEHFC